MRQERVNLTAGGNVRKSEAMKGKALAMMVASSACTENGKKSPAMSFHRYFLAARFSALQRSQGAEVPSMIGEFGDTSGAWPGAFSPRITSGGLSLIFSCGTLDFETSARLDDS